MTAMEKLARHLTYIGELERVLRRASEYVRNPNADRLHDLSEAVLAAKDAESEIEQ